MIYIDASRYNNTEKRTGVEHYSYFLINELVRQHPEEITLISPRNVELPVPQLVIPFRRLWTHVRLSWEILKNKKIQTLFVPSHVLPLFYAKKSVITLHDVAFKDSPQSYSWKSRVYLNWASKFAVKNASQIIVPSTKTKEDLMKFYRCEEGKIHVIPLGFKAIDLIISEKEERSVLKKHKLRQGKYFLYLGRIEWKKNSDTLIKAFLEFCKENDEIKLVIAGFPGHGGEAILNSIPQLMKERIILPGYISEKEKQVFLKNALSFIFPSREEGFGIPLLEAMQAGLPLIASAIPTSKEIAKDNALFFEPEDSKALRDLMKRMADPQDKAGLKTENHEATLKKYSWEKCAQAVYEVLIH